MQKFTNDKFKWDLPTGEYHHLLPKYLIGKLVAKVPMHKVVVTEDNRLYEYHILSNGKVLYQYIASVISNDEK